MAEAEPFSDLHGLAADRAAALKLVDISRETLARLDRFVALLLRRHQEMNLIGRSTLGSIWTRHIADSFQLIALARKKMKASAPVWTDLGTGAGFPGLVIACALAGIDGVRIHLIESNTKKVAFLRDAVQETGVPATVHCARIEAAAAALAPATDVVTARALAPLDELLSLAAPFVQNGAQALLPKGQHLDTELTKATKYWIIKSDIVPSKTSPTGKILVVHELSRHAKRARTRSGAPT